MARFWLDESLVSVRSLTGTQHLFQISRQPVQERRIPELRVMGLQNPVSFIGEHYQLRRHTLFLQRIEEFQRLRVRHPEVPFSGNHQRRRFELL